MRAIVGGVQRMTGRPSVDEAMMSQNSGGQKSRSSPHWFSKRALEEALSRGGCVICHALRASARRYLHSFIYEGMMSSLVRQDFLAGGGFCAQHFWEARQIEAEHWAEGFGVAILCENLLEAAQKDLCQWGASDRDGRRGVMKIGRRKNPSFKFMPGKGCITCRMLKGNEEHLLRVLEEVLEEDARFREGYAQGSGLCIFHLQAGLAQWQSTAAREFARQTAEDSIQELLAELQEFQRKHDYRYKNDPKGREWSSPERAITLLIGLPMAGITESKTELLHKGNRNSQG